MVIGACDEDIPPKGAFLPAELQVLGYSKDLVKRLVKRAYGAMWASEVDLLSQLIIQVPTSLLLPSILEPKLETRFFSCKGSGTPVEITSSAPD